MNHRLSLKLDVSQEVFVESESIKASLTISNNDSQPIRLEDLTISNNPIFFKIVDKSGKEFSCSLQSLRERDGVGETPPLEKTWLDLKPGGSKAIRVDLVSLLPRLPVGVYEVTAYYRTSPLSFLLSNKAFFEIVKMNCIYAKTTLDYAWYDNTPFYTAWVHENGGARYLFSMISSSNSPQNVLSNERVRKIAGFKEALCSIPAVLEQERRHIIWTDGNVTNIGLITNDAITHIGQLDGDYGATISPPITTEYGELKFLTLSKKGDESIFFLVRVLSNNELDIKEVFRGVGNVGQHSIIFDKNRSPHIAFTLDNAIFYMEAVDGNVFKAKKVFGDIGSKVFVKLIERFSAVDMRYRVLLNYTLQEDNRIVSSNFDPVDSKHLSNYYIPLPIRNLSILQVMLDDANSPYFLLGDGDGNLWLKGSRGEMERATLDGEKYPGNLIAPTLLLSSSYNVNYGIYLRYVKGGEFVYRKLKALRA